jgi:hypothetical protein
MGGSPKKISAGNVMKLPPPATELSTPPKKPARKSNTNSNDIFNNKPVSMKRRRP